MKYHVNPQSGLAEECDRPEEECAFGGDQEHYTSLEAAERASAKLREEEFTSMGLKKEQLIVSAEEVEELIDELYDASDKYYQRGEESPLTDEEFDAKLTYLQSIADSGAHGGFFKEGTRGFKLLEEDPSLGTTSKSNTVLHGTPMLSLAKAKQEGELYGFLNKARQAGAKAFRLQAKLDGLALAVEYAGGKISRISTRGDGVHGEDVTYLVNDTNVKVPGLQHELSETGVLEVRGELFFLNRQFQAADDARFAKTGVRFKNARNAATGLLKAAKQGVDYPVEFTFAAYSVLKDNRPADMELLKRLGFHSVDELSDEATPGLELSGHLSNDEVMEAIRSFGELRPGFDFPTDGVVIKPTNEAEMHRVMGFTSHHPASQVAWKYPAETATTEVLSIGLTVGRSGRVTPVAKVRPVDLDGSRISNASLHNFNLVHTKNIRVGSVVLIEKANEIIPQVKVVLSNPHGSKVVEVPDNCPSCSTLLAYDADEKVWPPKTLRCPNDLCDSRNFFALKTAVGKGMLDIDGMSDSSLDYLNSIGRVKDISDIYTLTLEELADSQLGESENGNPRRMGEKRAQHILEYIEKSKIRPLVKMLPALSINLLGKSASKDLERKFGDLDGILAASEDEIAAMDGFGPIKAEKIYSGLKRRRELIEKLRAHGVTFGAGAEKKEPAGGVDLSGKSFAISGAVPPGFANRGQWTDYVEDHGGVFHSGPKPETTYMVGDPKESSAKVQKANKLGIEFISPAEFTELFV